MRRLFLMQVLVLLVISLAPASGQITLIATGSTWKYLDTGVAPTNAWKTQNFDDELWASGPAPLGYGDGTEATVVASGLAQKPVTIYFRKQVVVPAGLTVSRLTVRLRCDDGAVIYRNGFELGRVRLPAGTIGPLTPATTDVDGVEEHRFIQRGGGGLSPGTNLIAVELHQSNPGLADAAFDLELIANLPVSRPQVTLTAPANGAIIEEGAILLAANTYDADGHVYLVQFLVNDYLITNVFQEPFTASWTPPAFGNYALSARAIDNSGYSSLTPSAHIQYGQELTTQLTRGPYLQSGSMTSIVVRWRTDWFADTWVAFGTNAGHLGSTVADPKPVIEHEAHLTGLQAGTRYFYAIGSSEGQLAGGPDYCFVTAPESAQKTRIWAIGDFGTRTESQFNVRNAYYDRVGVGSPSCRNTDVWLMLGDNAYDSGTDAEYQTSVFDVYGEMLRRSVVWPTLGNHDAGSLNAEQRYPYMDIFTLPQQGEAGGLPSGREQYYSFDYGNIHFVCLDATSSDRSRTGPMLAWLEQDLAATGKDWIIAYWHQPPYTFGSHNSDAELDLIQMRENALPLLEAYGVDLVLCGHSHVYERSYLLNGHYGFSGSLLDSMILNGGLGRDEDESTYQKPAGGLGALGGTVYVVCGCSGEGGAESFRKHPAHAVNLGGFGSVIIEVDGLRLDGTFLRDTGAEEDTFTIVKGLPAQGVSPELTISRAGGEAAIAWPTSLRPFQLETTATLGSDIPWSPWASPPVTVGRSNIVTVALDRTNRIFRLRANSVDP